MSHAAGTAEGSAAAEGAGGVITGNHYDKYGSGNPVVRRLMAGFQRSLNELLAQADPASVLDVGCGEGVQTYRLAQRLAGRRVVGVDLDDPALLAEWERRSAPNLSFQATPVESLPFADGEFDLVSAMEVLEHVEDPERALAEMVRCSERHLLVSVPREPLFRGLNIARGAYWSELGNTPGHLNHWSRRSFVALLARHGEVVQVRTPLPWTMLLVRV